MTFLQRIEVKISSVCEQADITGVLFTLGLLLSGSAAACEAARRYGWGTATYLRCTSLSLSLWMRLSDESFQTWLPCFSAWKAAVCSDDMNSCKHDITLRFGRFWPLCAFTERAGRLSMRFRKSLKLRSFQCFFYYIFFFNETIESFIEWKKIIWTFNGLIVRDLFVFRRRWLPLSAFILIVKSRSLHCVFFFFFLLKSVSLT